MSCQKQPYRHADGAVSADADSCGGCSLNHSHHCDGWRTEKAKKRPRRAASMKPKRKEATE